MRRQPYPLQWPPRLARTPANERRRSHFGKNCDRGSLSPHSTANEVIRELVRLGADNWVITSCLPSKGPEGVPYADGRPADDAGIAVWFDFRGVERVFACDLWWTPAENLRAIAKSIVAQAERHVARRVLAQLLEGGETEYWTLVEQEIRR